MHETQACRNALKGESFNPYLEGSPVKTGLPSLLVWRRRINLQIQIPDRTEIPAETMEIAEMVEAVETTAETELRKEPL